MSRSVKVRPECIQKVKLALKRNGFPSQKAFAIEIGLARSTVQNFLNGKPVDYLNFVEISEQLGLDWQEIANFTDEQVQIDKQDWGDVPDVFTFYGRIQELNILNQWIVADRCRLVTLWGLGGIGKTALAVQVAKALASEFEYVIWRSLQALPLLNQVLEDIIKCLSSSSTANTRINTDDSRSTFIRELRAKRCLVVLDGWETILQSGVLTGNYKDGYQNYGELLRSVGETDHQSCLILTSREKPREIAMLEGPALPIRSLQLSGLGVDAREILREKGLFEEDKWEDVIKPYRGNPLALKMVAAMIRDLPFDGNISEFLKDTLPFLGDLEYLLHQQFNRLTALEKQIMYLLGSTSEPVSLSRLQEEIQVELSTEELRKALGSLGRRSLLETVKEDSESLFTLQPVVMKYIKIKMQ